MKPLIINRSGCLPFFGLIFVGSGSLVLWMLLTDSQDLSAWERIAVAFIGAAHFAGGLFLIAKTPPRRVEIDPLKRTLRITTRTLRGKRVEEYHGNEIAGGRIVENKDSDGDPIFMPQIMLNDGRWITLLSSDRRTREQADADLQQIYSRLLGSGGLK